MTGFRNAYAFMRALVRATLKPRPRLKFWQWADRYVTIPDEVGGPMPGRLNTGRFPIFRGLYDLAQQRHVHHVALCASARVGKTLFSIVIMLYWLAERVENVVWLEPSGASAKKLSKTELQPFIERCPLVWRLALLGKTTWQILWKQFRGKSLRIIGSGAEADLHGFNAGAAFGNELDRQKQAKIRRRGSSEEGNEDASSWAKVVERTILFPWTRLCVENSTPGVAGEFSPIWTSFKRGSQHYCYVPCPHCTLDARRNGKLSRVPKETPVGWSEKGMDPFLSGWQRLSFSVDKKLVPFDENLMPLLDANGKLLPTDQWREETTGQFKFNQFEIWQEVTSQADATKKVRKKTGYRMDDLERDTTYECPHCKKEILGVQFRWMIERYRWVAHNPHAPSDMISAHVWRAYCPPELGGSLGRIVKEFLAAKKDVAALIKWHNMTCGLPFIRTGSAVKEDDLDRVIARNARKYAKGELPLRPEILAITVDKQKEHWWYGIRAYGVLWDHPDQKTWSALIDWGRASAWEEILELAGEKADSSGELRRFVWVDPVTGEREEFAPSVGLVDSGDEAEIVYECCLRSTIFDPYKGAPPTHTKWSPIKISEVHEAQLNLWLCWSNYFAANLYYDCIKDGQEHGEAIFWWLPTDIDDDYRKQTTDEYQDGDGWLSRTKNNHLGDMEKMQRALARNIETKLDAIRDLRAEEKAKDAKETAKPAQD